MTTRIETNRARHSPHVVPVDRLAGRLDGEGHTKVVNRWPDTNHAQNLRLAVAGQISFGVAENDSRVGLILRRPACSCHEDRTNRSDAQACCHHLKLDTTSAPTATSSLSIALAVDRSRPGWTCLFSTRYASRSQQKCDRGGIVVRAASGGRKMARTVAAAALAFCLSSSSLYAQSQMPQITEITVKTPTANVHKFPTVASAVIGKAPIGTVIEVNRNLGSWVEVAWPGGENGVGFLHVISVTITHRLAPASNHVIARSSPAATTPATQDEIAWLIKEIRAAARVVSPSPSQVILPNHVVGVGGRMSSFVSDLGGAARVWLNDRLGVQFEVSRSRDRWHRRERARYVFAGRPERSCTRCLAS